MQKRNIAFLALGVSICAISAIASFQVLFRVLDWAGPAYGVGESTLMGATGAAMARPLLLSLVVAVAASYIPKFRNVPWRYLIALGVLFLLFCLFRSAAIYTSASGS
jgi:hypothetical protein